MYDIYYFEYETWSKYLLVSKETGRLKFAYRLDKVNEVTELSEYNKQELLQNSKIDVYYDFDKNNPVRSINEFIMIYRFQ